MLVPIWMDTSMASPYKSLNLGKKFLRISRIRKITVKRILARVFAYLPSFISQILDFIYSSVLIFILIDFELRDTENQQFLKRGYSEAIVKDCFFLQDFYQHWQGEGSRRACAVLVLREAACEVICRNCPNTFDQDCSLKWTANIHLVLFAEVGHGRANFSEIYI